MKNVYIYTKKKKEPGESRAQLLNLATYTGCCCRSGRPLAWLGWSCLTHTHTHTHARQTPDSRNQRHKNLAQADVLHTHTRRCLALFFSLYWPCLFSDFMCGFYGMVRRRRRRNNIILRDGEIVPVLTHARLNIARRTTAHTREKKKRKKSSTSWWRDPSTWARAPLPWLALRSWRVEHVRRQ